MYKLYVHLHVWSISATKITMQGYLPVRVHTQQGKVLVLLGSLIVRGCVCLVLFGEFE